MLQGIRGNVVQFLDDGILKSKVKVERRETRVVCLFSSTEEAEILPFFFFFDNSRENRQLAQHRTISTNISPQIDGKFVFNVCSFVLVEESGRRESFLPHSDRLYLGVIAGELSLSDLSVHTRRRTQRLKNASLRERSRELGCERSKPRPDRFLVREEKYIPRPGN